MAWTPWRTGTEPGAARGGLYEPLSCRTSSLLSQASCKGQLQAATAPTKLQAVSLLCLTLCPKASPMPGVGHASLPREPAQQP